MTIDEGQKKQVAKWIADGQTISEIQKRLEQEFSLRMTYLDVRLLINELQLSPKDQQKEAPAQSKTVATEKTPAEPAAPGVSKVGVSVDRVTRPGALVSGKVSFSDGQSGEWFLDQMGRLGFAPKQQGYRPSEADLETFQTQLQAELQKLGY